MLVRCDCGTEKIVQARYLREEKIKSCGCLRTASETDGHRRSDHPFYQIWKNMHARCNNRSHSGYAGCGALGVRVCERWHTFEAFIQDMGPRPPRTVLCRMDELKDYTPENTRWLTPMQQRALHNPPNRMSQDDRALACAI